MLVFVFVNYLLNICFDDVGGESEHSMGATAAPYYGRICSNWWSGWTFKPARDSREKTP